MDKYSKFNFGYKIGQETKKHSSLVHRQRAYYGIYLPNKDKYEFPFSYYEIHHRDGDKTNNEISNLKILTPQEHDFEHRFYDTYSIWENEFNKLVYPYLKKYNLGIEKIKKLWKKESREIRNYFLKEEFEELVKNKDIDELELNLRLRERNKEISLVTWKRVQNRLKSEGLLKQKKSIDVVELKKSNPFQEDKIKFNLYEKLRKKRLELAKENKVLPYMVFHNKTLALMVNEKPKNKEEMLNIMGVSQNNFDKYGKEFLECLNN